MAIENIFKTGQMLKVNLQAFAEEEEPPAGQEPNNTDPAGPPEGNEKDDKTGTGDGQQKPEGKEKYLPQSQVEKIAARQSKEATEKMLRELGIEDFENAKDGMAKFREWQESQKTEQDKQREEFEKAQNKLSQYEKDMQAVQYENAALKADVKPENVDDVVALAERRVTDEKDIDAAMKEVVEIYPQFKKTAEAPEENKPHFLGGSHRSDGNKATDPFAAKVAKYQNK